MATKEDLTDFLTKEQSQSIENYSYIPNEKIEETKMRKGDYIKFMYKYNYKFMEGGIVISTAKYPVVELLSYSVPKSYYNIDLSQVYVFYKKNIKQMTQRDFFEDLLESLKKK